jgi:NMD protein affecting ribosome stability and mRNA decay
METLICKKCGKSCKPEDFNEFTGMCTKCDFEDFERLMDEYHKQRLNQIMEDVRI